MTEGSLIRQMSWFSQACCVMAVLAGLLSSGCNAAETETANAAAEENSPSGEATPRIANSEVPDVREETRNSLGSPDRDQNADSSGNDQAGEQAGKQAGEQVSSRSGDGNPFAHRLDPLPFPPDTEWLNAPGPIKLADLRGRFVLFDFWTYCCINCMHVLPELKKLEEQYPNELVVVGVHSAKFDTEKNRENIEEAILRYEIAHPVINDAGHVIWNAYGVRSWPTILLMDPEGKVVWGKAGEFTFDDVHQVLSLGLPHYRAHGLVANTPFPWEGLAAKFESQPLKFPGKILADAGGQRLFISDSNHNRIVVTDLNGQLLDVIGSGAIGQSDGGYAEATFNHPQGVALHDETLYIADTENHLIRKVSLTDKAVTTIAGLGEQSRLSWPGLEGLGPSDPLPERWVGSPPQTALNSPWALWVHDNALYIAMAGPHQIWRMPLDESEIGPFAGNGREDIVDGPMLPKEPYELGYASFAQPSGLASDGQQLFVADSEGSSIRTVPFDSGGEVGTLLGTSREPFNRLFLFGDQDGSFAEAKLQHPLGVSYHDGMLYVADTYNSKIKAIDLQQRTVTTLAGTEEDPQSVSLDEPAGISYAAGKLFIADTNNHAIRVIELASGKMATLAIAGLTAPEPAPQKKRKPSFPGAKQVKVPAQMVKTSEGKLKV
ncbi:MAG: redoxin domain-containing protein, partial [Planctomycetales bacterium]|nr:redoxin domain-containing protein [Planctomycetales bacterium]